MKILYKENPSRGALGRLGICGCMIKRITQARDGRYTLKKPHYHTSFEVHIFEKGNADYLIDGELVHVETGDMLVIAPRVVHDLKKVSNDAEKFTLTFVIERDSVCAVDTEKLRYCLVNTPPEILGAMRCVMNEPLVHVPKCVIDAKMYECVAYISSLFADSDTYAQACEEDEDTRLTIAKQYVKDNASRAPTVGEVAAYCCISPKQLTRIFLSAEGIGIAEYIRRERCAMVEGLLASDEYTLSEISEMMSFSSEYYFNAFFKKNSGMTPGAYRKSVGSK